MGQVGEAPTNLTHVPRTTGDDNWMRQVPYRNKL